jgi:hypothetical protein
MSQQTQSVSFTKSDLMTWLNNVMPNADELRVFMGRFPSGYENEGRTSVILWPYKNGQPATDEQQAEIEPYDDGAGHP